MQENLRFKSPVTVAHLVTSLNAGGVASLLQHILPELKKRNVNSIIIVTMHRGTHYHKFIESGIPVYECYQHWKTEFSLSYRLGRLYRKSAALSVWLRLALLLKKLKPHLLHSHVHGWLCTSQLTACRLAGIPYVLKMGSTSSSFQKSRTRSRLFAGLLRPQDRVFGVSPSIAEAYPQFFELCRNHVVSRDGIANGMRDPGLKNEETGSQIRAKYGIPNDAVVLGSVGRFIASKQYVDLIRAAKNLVQGNYNVYVLLVGDGGEFENLKSLSESLGLAKRVVFPGLQFNPSYWLNAMDIYVLPTQFEAFPISLLEAKAQGIPIVCSNVYGNKNLIQHGENGLLYPLYNIEELSECILNLIKSPNRQKKFSQAGRNEFISKYQDFHCAERWIHIYQSMLSQK